jgi:hypothetical protein
MKAATLNCILTGFSSRVDGSLAFRGITPEMSVQDKCSLMSFQNLNVKLLIQPVDSEVEGLSEIKGEFDSKSPSQRLRGCLYRLWQYETAQKRCEISFQSFYLDALEILIQGVKDKLPQPDF